MRHANIVFFAWYFFPLVQEWEEQLNQTKELAEGYKEKYARLKKKESAKGGEDYMDQARTFNQQRIGDTSRSTAEGSDINNLYGSMRSGGGGGGRPASVASIGSGLAQQAKTIVNSMKDFNCNAVNERNGGPVVGSEQTYEGRDRRPRGGGTNTGKTYSRSASRTKSSRSFREYSRSPQRVDV
jgi:hypothetical protein